MPRVGLHARAHQREFDMRLEEQVNPAILVWATATLEDRLLVPAADGSPSNSSSFSPLANLAFNRSLVPSPLENRHLGKSPIRQQPGEWHFKNSKNAFTFGDEFNLDA